MTQSTSMPLPSMSEKRDALIQAWRKTADELGATTFDCGAAAQKMIRDVILTLAPNRDEALDGILHLSNDLIRDVNERFATSVIRQEARRQETSHYPETTSEKSETK